MTTTGDGVEPRARRVRRAGRLGRRTVMPSRDVAPLNPLDGKYQQADLRDLQQDIVLKKQVARFAMGVMASQLVIVHVAFYIYGFARSWNVSDRVMIVFVTENFAQVVLIVFAITRYLFPNNRRRP